MSSTSDGDQEAVRPGQRPTTLERSITGIAQVITAVGFFALVGGVAAGAAVVPYAWPILGLLVVAVLLGMEWVSGRSIRCPLGIDSIGLAVVALFGVAMGGLFLWALLAALWWYLWP
jgi:hypothetical protein